ncbi:MAG: UDP-N-acetylmuramate--L-alanine ligase [Holosporales bacterium]|nr:UDP-N-acetylmuramate--L-alanine ligase [Holosporales bacterium]
MPINRVEIVFETFGYNKVIHFVGIGGIGVSGLAEIMLSMGYIVKGSDRTRSANTERLEKLGIKVFDGHEEKNVGEADVVVYSSAIKQDNPELLYAKKLKIPVITRAEMLSQIIRFKKSIVVAGSHGKTTTTAICAVILEMASFYPTIVNGGVINSYNTNAKLGKGDWAVVESDESDGSFTHFFPTIGIVTNIDCEHINYYGDFENLKNAFKDFIKNTPFYGCCIVCVDDQNIKEVVSGVSDRRIVTYSIDDPEAMYRAIDIKKTSQGSTFNILIRNGKEEIIRDISIPMLGNHNIENSLAAVVMSKELDIDIEIVKMALAGFTGVNRRFTYIGNIKGGVKVVDDYAHHPTELESVLDSAHQATEKRIAVIFQPHRFTRLNNLFDEFVKILSKPYMRIITPVYKADDSDSGLLTSDDLFIALSAIENTFFINNEKELEDLIVNLIESGKLSTGDFLLFAGAGSISKWAHSIVNKIGE